MRIFIDAGMGRTQYGWFGNDNEPIVEWFSSTWIDVTNGDTTGITVDIIEENGRKYAVGQGAHTLESSSTKLTAKHKSLRYTAITKVLDKMKFLRGATVDLVLIVSLMDFKKDKGQSFIDEYSNTDVELTLNGKPVSFKIRDVIVRPESMGSNISHLNEDATSRNFIIDIGGQNITYALYDGLNAVPGRNDCDKNGLLRLAERLTSSIGEGWNLEQVLEILERKKKYASERIERLFAAALLKESKTMVDSIRRKLEALSWNRDTDRLVLSGGGAIALESYLTVHFEDEDVVFGNSEDNIRGIMRIYGGE